jgi:Putative transposase of IS4/5 family (DUF4096)
MTLESLARHLPDEHWQAFEPVLPQVVWCGNGRPPCSNRDCLHAVLYVCISGIGWKYLPPVFLRTKPCSTGWMIGWNGKHSSRSGLPAPGVISVCTASISISFPLMAHASRQKKGRSHRT